jgi:hypothetical protein
MMNKNIELGDLVRDIINGYQGIVFGIEPMPDGKVYIHFKRTKDAWSGVTCVGQVNRINAKNITILEKCDPPVVEEADHLSYLSTSKKLDLLLEHLGLQIIEEPAKVTIAPTKELTISNSSVIKKGQYE